MRFAKSRLHFVMSAAVCVPLSAQDSTQASQGSRVRVTAPSLAAKPVVGWIDAVGPTTMTLIIRGDSIAVVPLDAIDRLELSVQRWNRGTMVKRAARTGALAGFIPGLLIGLATTRDCSGEFLCMRELTILFSGMLGSLAGAGIGAIVGSQQPTDHWEPAEVEAIAGSSPEIPQPNGRR